MIINGVDIDEIILDSGSHEDSPGGCVMEWVSMLSTLDTGILKTDQPRCTNATITAIAIGINDGLRDGPRQELKPLIPRLLRAKRTSADDRIAKRLGLWAARQVMDKIKLPAAHVACSDALDLVEKMLSGDRVTLEEQRAATERIDRLIIGLDVDAQWRAMRSVLRAVDPWTLNAPETSEAPVNAYEALASAEWASPVCSDKDVGQHAAQFLSDLLDQHEKAMAEEGVMLEDEFCSFAEEL